MKDGKKLVKDGKGKGKGGNDDWSATQAKEVSGRNLSSDRPAESAQTPK